MVRKNTLEEAAYEAFRKDDFNILRGICTYVTKVTYYPCAGWVLQCLRREGLQSRGQAAERSH